MTRVATSDTQASHTRRWDRRANRAVSVAAHLIAIGIIFLLPEILLSLGRPHPDEGMRLGMYGRALGYIAVFYVNYLWLVPHFMIRRRSLWRFLALNACLIVVVMMLIKGWTIVFGTPSWTQHRLEHGLEGDPSRWLWILTFTVRDCIMCLLSAGLAVALRITNAWMGRERQRQQEMILLRQAELDYLRAQINPHFLFNTLNTIYALVEISPEKAQEAIHSLSDILRYVLYEKTNDTSIGTTCRVVRDYVTLMNMRLPPSRQAMLSIDIDGGESLPMAPMMVATLMENAFKHSVPADEPITLDITAKVQGSEGTVTVRATNPYDPQAPHSQSDGGIGLVNMRRRMHLLYGDNATLVIDAGPSIYTATFTLHCPA